MTKRDYSLLGPDGKRAVEIGLAAAEWYHTEVPRKVMKDLMQRSDQPAIRDTVILYGCMIAFAVAGIANAINIIDGFNGLASVVCICMLLSLAYVALQVDDMFVLVVALMVAGAAAGFLIWNYPAGLIFLGDGGAYFLGFMLGELSVLLVMRNPEVSTWYAALLLIYPVFETLFSIYRRLFVRGKSPSMPDGIHLHSLIFRRLVLWAVIRKDAARALTNSNALTSPYLWLLSLMAVLPATLFWRHSWVLILFCFIFVISYVWLYGRIVRFRTPHWMILGRRK